MFVLLATSRRWVHETAAVLAGVVALWLITYILLAVMIWLLIR